MSQWRDPPPARTVVGFHSTAGMLAAAACVSLGCCRALDQRRASCCDSADDSRASATYNESTRASRAAPPGAQAADTPFVSPWLSPDDRAPLLLRHQMQDDRGRSLMLIDLIGRPMAVSFVYTRCANPLKCRRAAVSMAGLRSLAESAGILDRIRLVLITYDPAWDTPVRVTRYARDIGLAVDDRTLFLIPNVDDRQSLFRDLRVPVSFNADGVAIHAVQLLLLDKQGRLARSYRTLIWNNEEVLTDLRRLDAE